MANNYYGYSLSFCDTQDNDSLFFKNSTNFPVLIPYQ